MKKVYLLLKTHNQTGKKYLCRHVTNNEKTCFTYKGSGTYWQRHLAVHGNDVNTDIIAVCETIAEAKVIGLEYSIKWNIVESNEFANLTPEDGQGGAGPAKCRKTYGSRFGFEQKPNRYVGEDNYAKLPEVRKKISAKLKGRQFSNEHKKNLSEACIGREPWNKGKANPHARTDQLNIKVECPHCNKVGPKGAMVRWHFDNCKLRSVSSAV